MQHTESINSLNKLFKRVKKYEESIEGGFLKKFLRLYILNYKFIPYFYTKYVNNSFFVVSQMVYGKSLFLPLIDANARFLYFFGTLSTEEYPLTKFLLLNLKDDDVFYDVGTSFGFYTFLASAIINKGEIHSFEPNKICFSSLEKSKNNNSATNVALNNVGLYSSNGEESFYGQGVSFYNGSAGYSLKSDVGSDTKHTAIAKIKTITLDSYTGAKKCPTVIKIDVEGGECDVLQGSKFVLTHHSPTVIIEVWSNKKSSKYSKTAVDYLVNLGYSAYLINEKGELQLFDRSKDIFDFDAEFTNLVFKKDS